MNFPHTYGLYGLRITTDLPLSAPSASEQAEPDLTVRMGHELSADAAPPPGEVWARLEFGNGVGTQVTRTESGWSLFYFNTAEIRLDARLRSATAHPFPGKRELLAILLLSSIPSWLLNLQGEPVLHASAVAVGGDGLAFLGAAGMGKSTLATLFCSAGADLITDDMLRVRPEAEGFHCHWGTGELRLRPSSAALAERFPRTSTGRSVDGRHTVLVGRSNPSLPRLCAIVIPRPSREVADMRIERLSAVQASFHLNGYARVLGWKTDAPKRNQFALFARLAKAVPVFLITIPWGPPFPADLPGQILRATGLESAVKHLSNPTWVGS